ncbi:IscS subfamily cysteine desulfurase [Candidatus Deianiraea vastatrix]|uniref:Cysteine desulfurase IscS n=1 Tax=Candidatus Deianiraea vastatrix TaxID=2163644 RepID=A0A5B8XK74_9RICK|nr:IscS subfamily cysteine desulfurase [Candidatus Deianiraea vastatrix]QED23867.1 Cysteine desulfurase [Candidatus Deianiraea vastatrix]
MDLQSKNNSLYLDYQASTPVDPEVLAQMMKAFETEFGNPHSRSHIYGWHAEELVDIARLKIATLIGAKSDEIIFTSGATESNNLAIKGLFEFYSPEKNHIITLTTEHKCLIESCRYIAGKGANITFLKPSPNGLIDPLEIKKHITEKTLAVSIMGVHNEIGVIQNLEEIGKICREHGIFFHTDCAQAFGKIPLDVDKMNIDLMSISGHKIYGPKGVGALYIRKKPRVKLTPIIHGGGQERGLRSGTLPAPLICGFGVAAQIASEKMESDYKRIKELSDYFIDKMLEIPYTFLNGDRINRHPGNINISFAYVEGESLLMAMKGLAVSSGSACTSASLEPSYVLKSLGLKDELAHSSIRFGIGRFTTKAEVDYAISTTKAAVEKLRELSPLWEMVQDGIDPDTIQWNEH